MHQRKRPSVIRMHPRRPPLRDGRNMAMHLAEEPFADRVPPKQFVPAHAGQRWIRVPRGGERRDGLRIGVQRLARRGTQHSNSRPVGRAQPARQHQRPVTGALREDQPPPRVGKSVEMCGNALNALPPSARIEILDEQRRCGFVAYDS